MTQANDVLKEKYNDLLQKYEDASGDAIELREANIDIKNKLTAAQAELQRHHSLADQLRSDKGRSAEEVKDLRNRLEDKEAELDQLRSKFEDDLRQAAKDRDELIRTLSRLKSKVNKLEDSSTKRDTTKVDVYLAEIDRLMIEKDSLQDSLEKKDAEIDRLRKNLENQIHKMPGRRDNTRDKQSLQPRTADIENTNKRKVRNYNIRDDSDFGKQED